MEAAASGIEKAGDAAQGGALSARELVMRTKLRVSVDYIHELQDLLALVGLLPLTRPSSSLIASHTSPPPPGLLLTPARRPGVASVPL